MNHNYLIRFIRNSRRITTVKIHIGKTYYYEFGIDPFYKFIRFNNRCFALYLLDLYLYISV